MYYGGGVNRVCNVVVPIRPDQLKQHLASQKVYSDWPTRQLKKHTNVRSYYIQNPDDINISGE